MIYTITFISCGNTVRFGFNKYSDLFAFLTVAIDAVDGFEAGHTQIVINKEKEEDE